MNDRISIMTDILSNDGLRTAVERERDVISIKSTEDAATHIFAILLEILQDERVDGRIALSITRDKATVNSRLTISLKASCDLIGKCPALQEEGIEHQNGELGIEFDVAHSYPSLAQALCRTTAEHRPGVTANPGKDATTLFFERI